MIHLSELDATLVHTLPELASDLGIYEKRRKEDPEFLLSFFSYSFVPTLQGAIDQDVNAFCERAFALLERLISEGDEEVFAMLHEEFFDYGPACEKWMRRAHPFMGPRTRALAERRNAGSSS